MEKPINRSMSSTTSKLPFIEVIQWTAHAPDVMMWKIPDGDQEIKNGAQLIVRESQNALFINQGQIADLFSTGTHRLHTANIPILSRLKGWSHGFESPFKADIYFFSVKQFVGLKWGTPTPLLLNDPKFGQVRLRAFGSYNVRISDPAKFFKEYAGSYPELRVDEFQQQLRDYIAPKFAEALALAEIPLLEVAKNHSHLNARIRPLIAPYFEAFGISLTEFTVTSVSLPDEVSAHFDQVTGMNMVGDQMAKFQQFQIATAIGKDGSSAQQGAQQGLAMGVLMNQMPHGTAAAPQGGTATSSDSLSPEQMEQKLQQVKSLYEKGFINEQEYKAKKSDLLSKI